MSQLKRCVSVARDGRIYDARPAIDSSDEGLGVLESLRAKPHGDGERADAVMAEDHYVGVGIEFGVRAGRDVAHGHEEGAGKGRSLRLPELANVQQYRGSGKRAFGKGGFAGEKPDVCLWCDLRVGTLNGKLGHGIRIYPGLPVETRRSAADDVEDASNQCVDHATGS